MADEAKSWNALESRFAMQRIDHELMCSTGTGVYTNTRYGPATPPRQQWRASAARRAARHVLQAQRRFLRLLAEA